MVTRIKKSSGNKVPKTAAGAVKTLQKIGEAQDSIDEIQDAINKEIVAAEARIKEIRSTLGQKIAVLENERDNHYSLLERYARPRKKSLTSETRTERTAAGKYGWRYSPPSVQIAEGVKIADVVAEYERLGLHQFVRTTKTLNKKAMLAAKILPTFPGVNIVQDDEFFAEPKSKRDTKQGKKKNKTVIANM